MIKRLISILVPIAVLLLAVSSCMGSGPAPRATLAILNKEMARDDTGAVVARITVKNTSRYVAELAEVTVDFYDARKNLVCSASDSVMNLGPDGTWDFEIFCKGERCGEAVSCAIKAIAGTSSGRF